MRIVLVDDEHLIVSGLAKMIQKQFPDMNCICFTDPTKALSAIQDDLPDLLITDIRMPGISGMELIAAVRKTGLKYCAVLTGLNDVPLLQEGIRLGITDYLIKPVNKAELFSLVERVQQQIIQNRALNNEVLATAFRTAAVSETVILSELRERMKKSDDPLEVLNTFLKASRRDIVSWEVCRLATDILKESCDDAEMENRLRLLPLQKEIVSEEIRKIICYIRIHYAEEISLQNLAAGVYLQPNYVTTLFKKETGIGFIQYLNRIRIDAAVTEMLRKPKLPLIELAQECGFPSDRYFFTTFKKYTGETPGSFREWLSENGFIR